MDWQVNWSKHKFKIDKFEKEKIQVFTTRPDTLFGVTYLAISVNHPIINKISDENILSDIEKLKIYLKETKDNDKKKIGILTNLKAINPIN